MFVQDKSFSLYMLQLDTTFYICALKNDDSKVLKKNQDVAKSNCHMETVHTLNFNQFTTYSNYIYIYILYVYTHIELKTLTFYKSRGF